MLLVIGLIHAGLWYGDILKDYAAIGFVLIPLGRAKAKTIAWAAASVFALRLIWPGIMSWLLPFVWSAHARPDGGFAAIAGAFGGNNLSSLFFANLELVQLKALQTIYEGRALSILSMFLLGAWVGKLGLYRVGPGTRKQLSRAFWICAPVGIIGNAVLAPLHAATPDFPPNSAWVLENTLYAVAIPAMAVAYASGFAWLWASGWRFVLQWLAPAGRMALTTYISQTLIGIALFYGVGFGLHGQIGLLQGTILAFAIFAAQCAIARFWLRRFHFGPIEWIWRRLTYGAPITFVRTARPIE